VTRSVVVVHRGPGIRRTGRRSPFRPAAARAKDAARPFRKADAVTFAAARHEFGTAAVARGSSRAAHEGAPARGPASLRGYRFDAVAVEPQSRTAVDRPMQLATTRFEREAARRDRAIARVRRRQLRRVGVARRRLRAAPRRIVTARGIEAAQRRHAEAVRAAMMPRPPRRRANAIAF
jgi:hypothetical protein